VRARESSARGSQATRKPAHRTQTRPAPAQRASDGTSEVTEQPLGIQRAGPDRVGSSQHRPLLAPAFNNSPLGLTPLVGAQNKPCQPRSRGLHSPGRRRAIREIGFWASGRNRSRSADEEWAELRAEGGGLTPERPGCSQSARQRDSPPTSGSRPQKPAPLASHRRLRDHRANGLRRAGIHVG